MMKVLYGPLPHHLGGGGDLEVEVDADFPSMKKTTMMEDVKVTSPATWKATEDNGQSRQYDKHCHTDARNTIQDPEAAKQAVSKIMSIPQTVVQLVIDAQRLHRRTDLHLDFDLCLEFKDVLQLAHAAESVASSPWRQAELAAKIYAAEKALPQDGVEGRGDLKEDGQCPEAEEVVSASKDCNKRPTVMSEVWQCTIEASTEMQAPAIVIPERKESLALSPSTTSDQEASTTRKASSITTAASANSATTSPNSKQLLRQRMQALASENRKLRQRKVCRACEKVDLAESGITFLPCGHFLTCEKCADRFDDCPACGKHIMGTVRTFLS